MNWRSDSRGGKVKEVARGAGLKIQRGERPETALTVPQVCNELNVSRLTVYGLIDSGDLPAFRVGKNYRIEPEDLEHYKRRGKAQVRAHGASGALAIHKSGNEEVPA